MSADSSEELAQNIFRAEAQRHRGKGKDEEHFTEAPIGSA